MLTYIRTILAAAAEQRAANRDKAERAAIAKAFNDRYTYRPRSHSAARWMCPECNQVHTCIDHSVWDGRHFPACCGRHEGNRLNEGIRTC